MQELQLALTARSVAPDDEADEKDEALDREIEQSTPSKVRSGCGKEEAGEEGAKQVGEERGHETKTRIPNQPPPQTHAPAAPSPRHAEDEQRRCVELLLKSARAGHVGTCLYCVLLCGVSLSHQDDHGNTPLHCAAAQVLPLFSRASVHVNREGGGGGGGYALEKPGSLD